VKIQQLKTEQKEGLRSAKQKIKDMLKIRRNAKNNKGV